MITAACKGFPVLTASNCMAWFVKPHGKKCGGPIRNVFMGYTLFFTSIYTEPFGYPLGKTPELSVGIFQSTVILISVRLRQRRLLRTRAWSP